MLGRALIIVACAILGDTLVSYGLMMFGYSFVEFIGDLTLVEVAILFLIAGLIEFSSSISGANFRKAVFGSKQRYSESAHKESGRRALVLVLAGTLMFVILIAIAVLSDS